MPLQQKSITFDNHKLNYVSNDNKGKPPLLVLGPASLIELLPEDIKNTFNVMGFTFPYKNDDGLSKKFGNMTGTVDAWVKMVLFFSKAIKSTLGQKPVVLGHSLAGTLAIWTSFHTDAQKSIEKVIALNSPVHLQDEKTHNQHIDKVLEFFKYPETFYQDKASKVQETVGGVFANAMKTDFDENGIGIHVNFLRKLFAINNLPNQGKLPQQTKVPVLQVNAKQDPLVLVKQPDVKGIKYKLLDSGKHFAAYEFPKRVANEVLVFIQSQEKESVHEVVESLPPSLVKC